MIQEEIKQYFTKNGKKGGLETSKRHGKEHYQKLAANMNKVKRAKKLQEETAKTN